MADFNFISDILSGTTSKAISSALVNDNGAPIRSFFFTPIKSTTSFAVRATSIVTDTPQLAMASAVIALAIGAHFLATIGNFVTGNFEETLESLKGAGIFMLVSAGLAVAALFSPIINTVDLLGGMVSTVAECCAKPDEFDEFDQNSPQPR
ncbi:hypothetical protein [Legionella fallonii]|uniref:Uncharacterized protein n=1 Tax=Legionella fallonii LLAP-10 TaxID=1212491 RepID=A0A098G5W8_9GAMM|nr:hypothetical protein [Legionella fallonii]CEG56895.1 protein of unknown function [Legionella fallonii LLAP-10]